MSTTFSTAFCNFISGSGTVLSSVAAMGLSATANVCYVTGRGADNLAKRAAGTHTGSIKAFMKKGINYVPGYAGSTCSLYDTLVDNDFIPIISRKCGERDAWVLRRENIQATIYYSLPNESDYQVGQAVGVRIGIINGKKLERVTAITFTSTERHRHEKVLAEYLALTTPIVVKPDPVEIVDDSDDVFVVQEDIRVELPDDNLNDEP